MKEIENCFFYSLIPNNEISKIYDPINRKVCWRFLIDENLKIKQLKIIDLIEHVCCQRAFINLYKYSSVHSHSGFVSIEHFEKVRGKIISDEYSNAFTKQAIYLVMFLIKDITEIDENARTAFNNLPIKEQNDISGINKAFRNI